MSVKREVTVLLYFVSVCFQIQKVVIALGDYMEAKCHACIGGTSIQEDMITFKDKEHHTVVGTPGRVFDMINRKVLGKSFLGLSYFIMHKHCL